MIRENRPVSTIMQKKILSRLSRFDVQMSDGYPKSNTRTRRPVLLRLSPFPSNTTLHQRYQSFQRIFGRYSR
jgi:hypothetical protein